MELQALHTALRVLLLMTCLVVGQLHRLGVNLHAIQLLLPTLHENLDLLFGLLGLGIELGDSGVLQLGANVRKECDPMFARSIVGIGIENNANLVLALFKQLVNPRSTQSIHQTLSSFGMQIKIYRNRSQKGLILKELLVFLFQGFNIQTGQPFLPIDRPRIRCLGFLHQLTDDTRSIARTALFMKSLLQFVPHAFSRSTSDGCLMGMFLVVDLPQAIHILVFELHSLVLKTDNLRPGTQQIIQMSQQELTAAIRKYRELDESIKKINKGLTDLRDERGEVEKQMADILLKPEFQSFHKMELSDQS